MKTPAIMGPLGLFSFFTIIGLAPSFLLPAEQAFQAVWWGVAFGAPAAILVLVLSDPQPDYAVKNLLTLSWVVAIALMVAIILALPVIGGPSFVPGEGRALHMGGSFSVNEFAGMAGPRNTGLGRYAGVAALAALGRLWQERGWMRLFWVMVLPASLYILVAAQGRTEILAFIAGGFVILALRRMSRLVMLSWGIVATWLLATGGLLQRFWQYWTRGGRFDPSLTGRMRTWQQGWEVFTTSPWVGLGFHADRWFLAQAQHIHNGLLHALLQSGLVGTAAFVAAFVVALAFMVRLYWLGPESRRLPLAAEVPGILIFFTVMNVTESTAYFSANWMLLAPAMAYLQLAFWKDRTFRFGMARRARGLGRSRRLVVASPSTYDPAPRPPAEVSMSKSEFTYNADNRLAVRALQNGEKGKR
jgi:O-antigen ligase